MKHPRFWDGVSKSHKYHSRYIINPHFFALSEQTVIFTVHVILEWLTLIIGAGYCVFLLIIILTNDIFIKTILIQWTFSENKVLLFSEEFLCQARSKWVIHLLGEDSVLKADWSTLMMSHHFVPRKIRGSFSWPETVFSACYRTCRSSSIYLGGNWWHKRGRQNTHD